MSWKRMKGSGKKLHAYIVPDSTVWDFNGGAKLEAELVPDHMPVKNIKEMFYRLAELTDGQPGLIHTLTIGGHAGPNHFEIGEDHVYNDHTHFDFFPALKFLQYYLAPSATVILHGCEVGQALGLLSKFSATLGGREVLAWTGSVSVYKWWVFKGFVKAGDVVHCVPHKCRISSPTGF